MFILIDITGHFVEPEICSTVFFIIFWHSNFECNWYATLTKGNFFLDCTNVFEFGIPNIFSRTFFIFDLFIWLYMKNVFYFVKLKKKYSKQKRKQNISEYEMLD